MDLRQLNHLLAVVEHQSFSGAARALHTVQSNVSTHVARLERELGSELIDRRSMTPTSEGLAVIERARRIRGEIQAIEDDIVSMRQEVAGSVRIGCIGTTARWVATPLLERLGSDYPALHQILIEGSTASLVAAVLTGEIDMAVVDTPIVEPGLETVTLFDEERIVVAPRRHPLAERSSVSLEELVLHRIMVPPKGTTFRDALDQELATADLHLQAAAEVDGLWLLASPSSHQLHKRSSRAFGCWLWLWLSLQSSKLYFDFRSRIRAAMSYMLRVCLKKNILKTAFHKNLIP